MNDEKTYIENSYPKKLKKIFSVATVILLSACAFLGILAIFFEANLTLLCLFSTFAIIYLIFLVCMEDIRILSRQDLSGNWLSVVALIANVFWGLPWILVVWGAFVDFDDLTVETIWRVIGTSAVISIYCTLMPKVLTNLRGKPGIMQVFQSLPVVCATFLAFDFLVAIWVPEAGVELLSKFFWAECILVFLQLLVSQILGYSNYKGLKVDRSVFENSSLPNRPQQLQQSQSSTQNAPASHSEALQLNTEPTNAAPVDSDRQAAQNVNNNTTQVPRPTPSADEGELRAQIEREVRAKIMAEQQRMINGGLSVTEETESITIESTSENSTAENSPNETEKTAGDEE